MSENFTTTCLAMVSVALISSPFLMECSNAQTIASSTPANIPFTVPQDQDQFIIRNQLLQQQVLSTQSQRQQQQVNQLSRQTPTASPTNYPQSPNFAATSLSSASLQPIDRNTLAPTIWRGLSTTTSLGTPSTGSSSLKHNSSLSEMLNRSGPTIASQQQNLKFTLIAGKFWKFNITKYILNSSHREKELRLHRNISANNFIIDDDGWFQYNHQQQHLFAWPSLSTSPATYYFVLLPSGLDFEAEGENLISSGDVVANIVVELLPPVYKGSNTENIDQIIDHKYTLEYLHRHQSFPLLLSQIVSIFELLGKNNSASLDSQQVDNSYLSSSKHASQETLGTNASSVSGPVQRSKQPKSRRPLNEYLLINSNATSDGEFFTLTWTIQPSPVNSTIAPIEDCRLALINETVSKLSSRSILYPNDDDRFVVSYALEGPLTNNNTIIPTERGNYALQLTLNKPCRQRKIIEHLGLTSIPGIYTNLLDLDKDNNISELPSNHIKAQIQTGDPQILGTQGTTTTTSNPVVSESEKDIEANEGLSTIAKTKSGRSYETIPSPTSDLSKQVESLELNSTNNDIPNQVEKIFVGVKETNGDHQTVTGQSSIVDNNLSRFPSTSSGEVSENPAEFINDTGASTPTSKPRDEPDKQTPEPQQTPELQQAPEVSSHNKTSLLSNQTSVERQQQQQVFRAPSAKSFSTFLEPQTNLRSINVATMTESIATAATPTSNPSGRLYITSTIPTETTVANLSIGKIVKPISIVNITASPQETSLNEDMIGILNEVMEYLVSVAVPIAIIVGIILFISILIALCNLCRKKQKSKKFDVGDRFKFRYGSERRQFLRNKSKPVILEVDQKSLSMGSPQHKVDYQLLTQLQRNEIMNHGAPVTTSFAVGQMSHQPS